MSHEGGKNRWVGGDEIACECNDVRLGGIGYSDGLCDEDVLPVGFVVEVRELCDDHSVQGIREMWDVDFLLRDRESVGFDVASIDDGGNTTEHTGADDTSTT